MASLLKGLGHQVWYLDEIVRDGGLGIRSLSVRRLTGSSFTEDPVEMTPEEYQRKKMEDYRNMSSEEFARKYSAFKHEGKIERIIVRIGHVESETLAEIERIAPDVVGIPLIATANYLPATKLAQAIKERWPHVKVVMGGQHISSDPEGFLAENPAVDQVVTGDAISVIAGIVDGVITDRIVHGGFQEMSQFPLLDPTVIEDTGYPVIPTYTFPTSGRKSVDFMFSRGCFRTCEFCVAGCQKTHVTATGYEELEHQLQILKEHGIEELVVQDDAFLWDRHHVEEHLPKILALMKKYGFYWQDNGGLDFEGLTDFVTDQLIHYNSAGVGRCTALYIPFNPRGWNKDESAAASMTRRYHRNMENLKRLREAGIYIFTSSIIGTPEQTPESFREELAADRMLIEEGYLDCALPLSATMLPGTVWYAKNGQNIVSKEDYPGYSLFSTHHRTEHLEPQDIERMMVEWLKGLEDVQEVYSWGSAFAR